MSRKSKSGAPSKFFLILSLIILSFFCLIPINNLNANSEAIPISGTPRLGQQNYQLLKEGNLKGTIQAEKTAIPIFKDVVNQQSSFWAFNFNFPTNNLYGYYQITATCENVTLLNSGHYLYIYVEDGLNLSPSIINNIRNEFLNIILPTETIYFGSPPAKDFTILIMDIKDDYNPALGNTTYVSGYFDSRNEYGLPYSNNRSMIYLDASPGVPGTITFFGTLAHEFQHFIHYSIDPFEETWVNEGLSGLARYLCGYGHQARDSSQKRHIEAFARDSNTSLIIWNDSLANYGATYLFMLYLEKHYGGPTITRNIVANRERGMAGINNALWQSGYAVNFNDVFRNWVIANYLNNSSIYGEIYGYNDPFDGISPAPGKMQIFRSHVNYPAEGQGAINPYAALYINFYFLGGIYDIFTLIAYSIYSAEIASFAYSGTLGSLFLQVDGLSEAIKIAGVQEGTSHPAPIVLANLSANNNISTSGAVLIAEGGESSRCFITTALYASPLAKEVAILRQFRDQYLLSNSFGKILVRFYYTWSPALSNFISRHSHLKPVFRLLIYPAIGFSYASLRYPLRATISFIISLLIFGKMLKNKGNLFKLKRRIRPKL